ncbi:SMC5-SMC6 complex localization factor protein 2 isoform X2 [Myripristis murdjan]|uniref:SMC5-SMC6 complex localization factor protein 2 isoform X2 n=1 Tax=Myripristis murdjan TaxID=586833 RepID=UPI001175D5BE|nr:SMC5-SMC6 complex localization factor protein 2-like isoform X2 [Myripristis murdjan]
MRKTTENQGNRQGILPDYLSPRNKVKDFPHQRCSQSPSASYINETPMRPSQVPNRQPHPLPRRMLPLQSPELCHRARPGPPQHPPQPPGPVSPPLIALSRPAHIHSQAKRTQSNPVTSKVLQPSYPRSRRDISNYSPPASIRSDQLANHRDSLPITGRGYEVTQKQESSKVQTRDVRNSVHAVQLQRQSVPQSLTPRTGQEGRPLHSSDSESWGPANSQWRPWRRQSSQITQSASRNSGLLSASMCSPEVACQDHSSQQHKQRPSNEKLIPEGLNCSSLKRHRESENYDNRTKKPCLQDTSSVLAQTTNSAAGNLPCLTPVFRPSLRHSSDMELSPKTIDVHLRSEPAPGQLAPSTLSTPLKPSHLSYSSSMTNLARQPLLGVKTAYVKLSQNDQTVRLKELRSPSKPADESVKKGNEDKKKVDSSRTLLNSIKQFLIERRGVPHKDTGSTHNTPLDHQTGHTQRSTPVLQVKDDTRPKIEEGGSSNSRTLPKPAIKPNSEKSKNRSARSRKPRIIPDDISDLFTPDPLTYVVKPSKTNIERGENKSLAKSKGCPSSTVTSSSTQNSDSTVPHSHFAHDVKISSISPVLYPEIYTPTVILERVKLENMFPSKDTGHKNSSISSSGRRISAENVKTDQSCKSSLSPKNVRKCTFEEDTATSKHTPASHCSSPVPLVTQEGEGSGKQVHEEDPLDVELDLDLSLELDLDLTQSSQSSEDEQLLSLQEMMKHFTKPPVTPEKGALSEPSTPGQPSYQSKPPVQSTTKPCIYRNNLDQMLKEINSNKRSKEIEAKLITACEEDLLKIAENEEAQDNQEDDITTEQKEFLQRFSLMSSAIRDLHPGEEVFKLENFGRIFNQNMLQLRQCQVNPQETAQKTLLWSSPAQLRLHVSIGLFQEAYNSSSPCPTQVTRFLFKMMSVHNERMICEQILQALCHIACTAAYQIVKNESQQFEVWVPSVADVTLVLMNMGVPFVTLFPFENLQPPFTEGDLLEDIHFSSERCSGKKEPCTFPEHNCTYILKYLSYCMGLCTRAYSDYELLLLLTMVSRVGLDTQLALQPNMDLCAVQHKIINNFRNWDTMLPKICLALTDLTDDHHNMCWLVQLLPDNTRGKRLRRHLSLSMISKLLDGNCTYKPSGEFQLSDLRPYLPRMQPSTLLHGLLSSSSRTQKEKEEDLATLDQQTYYLCYSLLTLANEASNFQFFPGHQKEQLLFLCSELETHVKCDIRESEKCLYRSKVKDLVARIYTKWQMLLQRTRPLHDQLYDYWKPLSGDIWSRNKREEDMEGDDVEFSAEEEQDPTMEDEEEEEVKGSQENKDATTDEEIEGDCVTLKDLITNEGVTKDTPIRKDQEEWVMEILTEDEGDSTTDEMEKKTEETVMLEELTQEMPEIKPPGCNESDLQGAHTEERETERTEVETDPRSVTPTSCLSWGAACHLPI